MELHILDGVDWTGARKKLLKPLSFNESDAEGIYEYSIKKDIPLKLIVLEKSQIAYLNLLIHTKYGAFVHNIKEKNDTYDGKSIEIYMPNRYAAVEHIDYYSIESLLKDRERYGFHTICGEPLLRENLENSYKLENMKGLYLQNWEEALKREFSDLEEVKSPVRSLRKIQKKQKRK